MEQYWYEDAPVMFLKKKSSPYCSLKKSHNEVSELLWISEKDFLLLISKRGESLSRIKMWERIRKFYNIQYTIEFRNSLKIVYGN